MPSKCKTVNTQIIFTFCVTCTMYNVHTLIIFITWERDFYEYKISMAGGHMMYYILTNAFRVWNIHLFSPVLSCAICCWLTSAFRSSPFRLFCSQNFSLWWFFHKILLSWFAFLRLLIFLWKFVQRRIFLNFSDTKWSCRCFSIPWLSIEPPWFTDFASIFPRFSTANLMVSLKIFYFLLLRRNY